MDRKENIFNTNAEFGYSEEAPQIDTKEFEKVLLSRRSVRIFTDEPIPEAVTRRCLELALRAPSSSNLQCWEFHWIRGADKRQELIEICLGQNAAKTSAELIVCVGRTDTWRQHAREMIPALEKLAAAPLPRIIRDYYEKVAPLVYTQGPLGVIGLFKKIIVTLIGLFRVVPREPVSRADMKLWATKTTALACENLMLAFRAHGYDTCPMEGFDSKRAKKLLGLGRGAVVVMVIGAGKRSKKGIYGPQFRFPDERFIIEHF